MSKRRRAPTKQPTTVKSKRPKAVQFKSTTQPPPFSSTTPTSPPLSPTHQSSSSKTTTLPSSSHKHIQQPQQSQQPSQTQPSPPPSLSLSPLFTTEASERSRDGIIIFQCDQCRAVVADSTLGYTFDTESSSVIFPAACNVKIEHKVCLSEEGPDLGCTFRHAVCSHCSTRLGRVYVTTFPALDHRRAQYTLDADSIITHRVGDGTTTNGVNFKSAVGNEQKFEHLQQDTKHNLNTQQKHQQQEQQNQNKDQHPSPAAGATTAPSTTHRTDTQHEEQVSISAFQDLESHVDTVTNALNNITDAVKQNRADIKQLRKLYEDIVVKVVEGENSFSYVHNLLLVWDDRVRDIDRCKETINKFNPMLHWLDKQRSLIEERLTSQVARITAPAESSSQQPS